MEFEIYDARTLMQAAMYIRLFGRVICDSVVGSNARKSYVLGNYFLHTWSTEPTWGGYSISIHDIGEGKWKTYNYYPTATKQWCEAVDVNPATRFEVE